MALRSSAVAFSASGAITATPSGVQVDDYLGGWFLTDNATNTLVPPSGWTQRASIVWPAGSPDGGQQFYADKIATGSDSFQFSDTSNPAARTLFCGAWSGRDTASPRSTAPVTTLNTTSNASAISATINGITASLGDDIAIGLGTDQTLAAGRWTFSTIAGYTERQDGVNNDWTSGAGLQTQDNVVAGATGNFSVTITNSATGNAGYGGIVVAIKAGAVAAGNVGAAQHSALPGLPHAGPFAKPWLRRSHQPAYTTEQVGVPLIHQEQHTRESRAIRPGKGPFLKAWLQHRREVAFTPAAAVNSAVLGAASETNTAGAFGRLKTKALAGANTTEAAQAFGRLKTRALTGANTAETAQAFGRLKKKLITAASSAETAQALGRLKTRLLGSSSVAAAAQTITPTSPSGLQAVQEANTAQALGRLKTKAIAGASSAETSQAIGRAKTKALAAASSSETAQPLGRAKTKAIAAAAISSTAQPVARAKSRVLGLAAVSSTAQLLGRLKAKAIAAALEVNTAGDIGVRLGAFTPDARRVLEFEAEARLLRLLAENRFLDGAELVEAEARLLLLVAENRLLDALESRLLTFPKG